MLDRSKEMLDRSNEMLDRSKEMLDRSNEIFVCSSRDRIRRVGLKDGSMVEHLVMGLKTSPNHIGLSSALETGGWQLRDQHGHMRRLNQVNLSGFHRSQAKEQTTAWLLVDDANSDFGPCRAAYSNASGLSGSVTGITVGRKVPGKASIGSKTNEKCLKAPPRFYTFQTGCNLQL
ncbi:hypothetical protein TNCV_1547921 [Trichonephila clavipes]|nr:hypothetical protein TNCV_1547921 [Trichonephila clavipes]